MSLFLGPKGQKYFKKVEDGSVGSLSPRVMMALRDAGYRTLDLVAKKIKREGSWFLIEIDGIGTVSVEEIIDELEREKLLP